MRGQERHHVAQRLVLDPRRRDASSALWTDPRNLANPLRGGVQNLQRLLAKAADDPLRQDWADLADEPRPEIPNDAIDIARPAHLSRCRAELSAVARIGLPVAPQVEQLTGL